jgi:hypothetical protein
MQLLHAFYSSKICMLAVALLCLLHLLPWNLLHAAIIKALPLSSGTEHCSLLPSTITTKGALTSRLRCLLSTGDM